MRPHIMAAAVRRRRSSSHGPVRALLLLLVLVVLASSSPLVPPTAAAARGLAWTRTHSSQQTQQTPAAATMMYPRLPRQQQPHQPLLAYAGARGRGGRGARGGRRGGVGGGQGGFDLSSWTNRLLAVNVAVFLLQQVDPRVTLLGAKNDALIRRGEWHRLFTPMLLHGDVQHLLANSYTLYNLGHFIEPLFGGQTYLALYVLSGLAGNGLSFFSRRAPIAIGASTAVSGLLGAVGLFCVRHRKVWDLDGPLRSVTQAVVINGVLGASSRNIDNFGHLGGLLGGIACGFLFGPNLVPVQGLDGAFRGYANLPVLQTAVASLRRRLGKGLGGGGGPSSSNKRAALRPQQQQQAKRPNWLQRLGSFLHRGGESSAGGGYGGAGFVAPLTPPALSGCWGAGASGSGVISGRSLRSRPGGSRWMRPQQQSPRVWRAPYAVPLF